MEKGAGVKLVDVGVALSTVQVVQVQPYGHGGQTQPHKVDEQLRIIGILQQFAQFRADAGRGAHAEDGGTIQADADDHPAAEGDRNTAAEAGCTGTDPQAGGLPVASDTESDQSAAADDQPAAEVDGQARGGAAAAGAVACGSGK